MEVPLKIISHLDFIQTLKTSLIRAAFVLPSDVRMALEEATQTERHALAKSILKDCVINAQLAENEQIPLCQDTGTTVFFVQKGIEVRFDSGTLEAHLNEAVRLAYAEGYLRKSIVKDPLYARINTKDNTPSIIHLQEVDGDLLNVEFALKGGGAENMSQVVMLTPSAGEEGVVKTVVDAVKKAGGNPCPPIIVGIGIGSNFEGCALLAKKSLLRDINSSNLDERYAQLEKRLLCEINASNVGPQGLGGDTTALAVFIEHAPCHIASMPVAININCHSARHGKLVF